MSPTEGGGVLRSKTSNIGGSAVHPMMKRTQVLVGITVAIAVVAAIGVVTLLGGLWYLTPRSTNPGGPCSCGTAMALGAPVEQREGTGYWYNFSVQSAGGGLVLNNLNFQVQSGGGSDVTNASWTLHVTDLYHRLVGVYSFKNSSWISGGTEGLNSEQAVDLETQTSLSGDTFSVIGAGSFAGSITVWIP